MSLDALLHKASTAAPKGVARPRRWSRLWPVYSELRSRGFSCEAAVEWLKKEGEVPEGEEAKALNAFHLLATRRNKKR